MPKLQLKSNFYQRLDLRDASGEIVGALRVSPHARGVALRIELGAVDMTAYAPAHDTMAFFGRCEKGFEVILTPGERLKALLEAHPGDYERVAELVGLKPQVVSKGE